MQQSTAGRRWRWSAAVARPLGLVTGTLCCLTLSKAWILVTLQLALLALLLGRLLERLR